MKLPNVKSLPKVLARAFVPEGHSIVAQRFIAGDSMAESPRVPEGRLDGGVQPVPAQECWAIADADQVAQHSRGPVDDPA